jgi:predicted nucleic acid-binding protein
MKKLKLYIDTSVWNFLFDDDAPDKKITTEQFFKEIETGKYEVFISEIVTVEIGDAPLARREQLFEVIRKYSPIVLYRDSEVDSMADAYLESGLLTEKHYRDILHIAFAATNGVNILLSWNMRHIVKRNTQHLVNVTNRIHGYPDLEIWTPEGLMDYED